MEGGEGHNSMCPACFKCLDPSRNALNITLLQLYAEAECEAGIAHLERLAIQH